mmetsp:Transcript_59746/g.167434  ORF Transcript_59746/g.167434 Transcript_59746/m.167434 type:complete len:203 (-) Transcript_59746:304-912(-)
MVSSSKSLGTRRSQRVVPRCFFDRGGLGSATTPRLLQHPSWLNTRAMSSVSLELRARGEAGSPICLHFSTAGLLGLERAATTAPSCPRGAKCCRNNLGFTDIGFDTVPELHIMSWLSPLLASRALRPSNRKTEGRITVPELHIMSWLPPQLASSAPWPSNRMSTKTDIALASTFAFLCREGLKPPQVQRPTSLPLTHAAESP